jgi:hypothetical protein
MFLIGVYPNPVVNLATSAVSQLLTAKSVPAQVKNSKNF